MKVAVVCPFWGQLHHVGSFRVRRIVKWLKALGLEVVVLSAGSNDREFVHDGNLIIQVRDPLLRHRSEGVSRARNNESIREFSLLRRWLARFASTVLVPDLAALWMRRVVRDPAIMEQLQGMELVVSSSPPESALLVARHIAVRLACPLVTDLRDGWIDEPLKPQVESWLRGWFESRMERRVLDASSAIIVTSDHWKWLLERRLPRVVGKIHVITNAIPEDYVWPGNGAVPVPSGGKLQLLYAGRLGGSRRERSAAELLRPLLLAVQSTGMSGTIRFLGDRDVDEYDDICRFIEELSKLGWDLAFESSVDRAAALRCMQSHQGLLLLSNSRGCIPAKLLDYLAAHRPILAICPANSAVSDIGRRYRQMFTVFVDSPDLSRIQTFLRACATGGLQCDDPLEFSEAVLEQKFRAIIEHSLHRLPQDRTPHEDG